jgi:hypothetical protein
VLRQAGTKGDKVGADVGATGRAFVGAYGVVPRCSASGCPDFAASQGDHHDGRTAFRVWPDVDVLEVAGRGILQAAATKSQRRQLMTHQRLIVWSIPLGDALMRNDMDYGTVGVIDLSESNQLSEYLKLQRAVGE